ncbi:MAG: DUF721 domain-containing protein [Vicinamibacterales bacterium]
MKRLGPTRLSGLLDQALARLGLDRRLDDYRVWQAWVEVVGRTISRNAQPVRLDGSRLVVAVRSSTWLHELSLLQRELIVRINEWMKREVVRELFFVVGRIEPQEAPAPKRQEATAPKPQDTPAPAAPRTSVQTGRILPIQGSLTETPPPSDDLGPEASATFERLWRAARARRPGDS